MQDEYHEVLWVLISGTLLFMGLTAIVIFILLAYQKRRLQYQELMLRAQQEFERQLMLSQIETQEYTSSTLGQELHDNIGQLLSSTKMLMGAAQLTSPVSPEPLAIATDTLTKAIKDLRALSKSLSKEWLHQFNLVKNIQSEVERINMSRALNITFTSAFEKLPMEPDEQVLLFRVIQEGLQNSIRHAEAQSIIIEIKKKNAMIEVSLQDNGKGFNVVEAKEKSLGLRNMEQRVNLLKGIIKWTRLDEGMLITVSVPINNN